MNRVAAALASGVLLLGLAAHGRDRVESWITATQLPPLLTTPAVEVRARDGSLLRALAVEDGRMRLALHLDDTDPQFIEMLIAYEDKRFYSHDGVDKRALVRAVAQAAQHGKIVSGGSTLTMQVARLLENSGTGSVWGKLRQIRLALALERRMSKDQILTLYLLHAPYGGRIEGVRAASHVWFGKEPRRLTRAESALLVALPQAPESRRPDRHPGAARAARDRVLARLGYSREPKQADVPHRMQPFAQSAPHLAAYLHAADPVALRHDTRIDPRLQQQMEALARRAVTGQAVGVSAAIMVADHTNGDVLAYVGSPAYSARDGALGFVDMTRALRSPGSTLKPLIYGLAFDRGLVHPDTLINDAPVAFGRYAPQNFDGVFRGMLTVRDALTLSLNIPPVVLTHELGPAHLMAGLKRAGTDPVIPSGAPGLAVALGGVGLSLQDLMQLYAGIARGGQARPLTITAADSASGGARIMSDVAAWQVTHILSNITPPKGAAARAGEIAYKTGTSYGHRDAWAIGFDGRHVVGIWLGRPDGTPVPGAFGGDLAAPILFEAFGRIGPKPVLLRSPPPDTLIAGTARLPQHLRVFRSRTAAFAPDPQRPQVRFPPDGAVLRSSEDGVPLKFEAGTLPLTVLINGAPVMTTLRRREAVVHPETKGFARIAVMDAKGRSDSVLIRLD